MTNKEWRRDFLLQTLIACLAHKWTLGGNPLTDLAELGINVATATQTLQYLINQGICKKTIQTYEGKRSLLSILTSHETFREAIIFTDPNADLVMKYSLDELKIHWFRLERSKNE